MSLFLPTNNIILGDIRGQCPQLFCGPQVLLCPERCYTVCFKHIIKTKSCPSKNVFSPQTVKPCCGLVPVNTVYQLVTLRIVLWPGLFLTRDPR